MTKDAFDKVDDTIEKLEQRLNAMSSVDDRKKREFLSLIETLRSEVDMLEDAQADKAESIKKFADLSSHEATKSEPDQQLLDLSLEGLTKSVDGFEVEHPKIVEAVNNIANMLSNIGI